MSSTQDGDGLLFLSHASADKSVAEAVTRMLRLGTGVSHRDIRCTSLDGMKVAPTSRNYLDQLNKDIREARLFVPLITPAFFDSRMCLIELGALWALAPRAVCLIAPPVTYDDVTKLLGPRQIERIDDPACLSRLRDTVEGAFDLHSDTAMWDGEKDEFLAHWHRTLSGSLAEPKSVPAEKYAKLDADLAQQRQTNDELRRKIDALTEQNRHLHAAKTPDEADGAMEPTDEVERFRARVAAAVEALGQLPAAVAEAFFEGQGEEGLYRPDYGSRAYDAAEEARRDGYLTFSNSDDEGAGYAVNSKDSSVEKASTALDDVFDPFPAWSGDLLDWFKQENGFELEWSNHRAWDNLGLT